MKKGKKILILVPAFTARGGITNYYEVLREEFSENIEYLERGARSWPNRKGFFYELYRAFKDYQAFKKRLGKNDIALVQTTTSLGFNTTIRDGLFVRYANKKGLKTVVFFRGWDDAAVKKVERSYSRIFKFFFFGADKLITLSEKAKNDLKRWGYNRTILVETTLVDKNLLLHVNEAYITQKYSFLTKDKLNLLYLSRVERGKGIYELLQAYKILLHDPKMNHSLHLNICGDGSEMEHVRQWITSEKLTNIELQGFVSGDSKKMAFDNAHIFVFPSHGEGMPNAVLEAMGFGLPVVTTPVGGIVDFLVPGRNGYFIAINDVQDVVDKIKKLLHDKDKMHSMALKNYDIAKDIFRSDKVARRMDSIFNEAIVN
jgi:glycosyltransferase involved in cell wall biosynthesis